MNTRFTAFLYVAVVAVTAAMLAINLFQDPPRLDAGLVEPLALVSPDKIERIEIERSEPPEKLVFARTGPKTWALVEPYTARADGLALDELVRALYEAKPVKFKDLTSNLKVHGLDDPVKVTLTAGDATATVGIGDTTIGGADSAVTFVLPADRPKSPVAVRTAVLQPLFRDAAFGTDGAAAKLVKRATDFRLPQLLTVGTPEAPGAGVQALKLSRGGATVKLTRTGKDGWTFTEPAGYGEADAAGDSKAVADQLTGVRPLLAALATLSPASRDDYLENVSPADLLQYGLAATDPSALRIEVTPTAKGVAPEVLFVGKPVEVNGVPAVPAKVYCRLEGDPAVVKVPADRVRLLTNAVTNPSPLRNRDLMPAANGPRIDAIDVTVEGSTFQLRRIVADPQPRWAIYGGQTSQTGPAEVMTAAVDDLIRAATMPRTASDVVPPNDEAFDPKKVTVTTVTFHFDAVTSTPPADGKLPAKVEMTATPQTPPVTLTFGQRTPAGTAIHVRRTVGTARPTVTDFLLPLTPREGERETLAALATRLRLAYLNPNLGSFSVSSVTQLKAMRGKDGLFDLTFTEPGKLSAEDKALYPSGRWDNWTKPAAEADVHRILFALATALDQAKPVAEAPPDPELTKMGLNPARVTVWVTLKSDPANPRAYEFGTDTQPPGKVYFRLHGRLMVLTAAKHVVDVIEKPELRDPVVHRVPRSAITQVDLSWRMDPQKMDAQTIYPDPAAQWSALNPPAGFTLDPVKAEALVKLLEAPPPGEYLTGPEKPEHKLTGDMMKAVLQLGPARKVELILGAEDLATRTIFAKSSELPGVVVRLPVAPFKPYLAGRKALGK